MTAQAQAKARMRGEPACRPGSVIPGFLTCHYSSAWPSGLRGRCVTLRDVAGRFGAYCVPDVCQGSAALGDVGAAARDDPHQALID